jgi:hypothetical protein
MYQEYRKFVSQEAPKFRGNDKLDCADMSITLLIKFAALKGLPVTFWDNNQARYISKAMFQTPTAGSRTRAWTNVDEYLEVVRRRVNTAALVDHNMIINPRGPEPGDLMGHLEHASLVFAVYPPGVIHPRAYDKSVPVFPGNDVAETQLNQTEYFRTQIPPKNEFGPTEIDAGPHFDYLNHRSKKKPQAELIYFANVMEMRRAAFYFRMYKPGVIDNWIDWKEGDVEPRR